MHKQVINFSVPNRLSHPLCVYVYLPWVAIFLKLPETEVALYVMWFP